MAALRCGELRCVLDISENAPEEMMPVRDFRDLRVWQKSIALARECYALSRALPHDERFGQAGQIRRAACSVGANIVEGHARPQRAEFLRFIGIARASLQELEHHLLLAVEVGYLDHRRVAVALGLADEVGRMLSGLRRSLVLAEPRLSSLASHAALNARPQHTASRNRSQS
jgi:four helix bundle protein